MEMQMIYLRNVDWLCEILYEVEKRDAPFVKRELMSIGCKGEKFTNAMDSVLSGEPNRGVTYSNLSSRSSIVLMTWTTDASQFNNTLDHEKNHLVRQIGAQNKIDPWGEEEAYLRGEIAQKMFCVAKRYLCQHCRENKKGERR